MGRILTTAIIGVGSRGAETYGRYFKERTDLFKISSLCDINPVKIEKYSKEFDVPANQCFLDEDEFFKERRADVIVISTLDQDHVRQAMKAIALGYDILLEKPIATDEDELLGLLKAANEKGTKVLVCHVLRYTVGLRKVKELLDSGAIGDIMSIDHLENVMYWHQAHSYVRGNWRKAEDTAPMIFAKCCHDLDLLQWFAGSKCKTVSSYGDLRFFKKENAPKEATKRCMDCPLVKTCPYSAYRIYVEKYIRDGKPVNCWPYNVLSDKPLNEEVMLDAIKTGPYGRCVFYCDNDVVDTQSVNMEFENGIVANLKMTAFSKYGGRYIHFFGTYGDLIFDETQDIIKLHPFGMPEVDKEWKISELTDDLSGHGGGDHRMMDYLYDMIVNDLESKETSLAGSIESHLIAAAAEESRLNGGKLVTIKHE